METTKVLKNKKLLAPTLRFKEFNESWKLVKLGDIGSTNGGLTYSPNDVVEDENKGILVLRSSNVQNGMMSFHDNVYVNCLITEKDLVKENDILLCVRNGSKNLIGKNLLIKKEHVGFAFGAFMAIYRSDSNPFVFHFFKSAKFYKQVHEHLGATINQITGRSLNSFNLFIPAIPEQQKIASFLSAVDEKIQQLCRKKELLEQYKKGVMQQLFTGKLRFKDENGKVFQKWEEKRLGDVSKIYDGTHQTPTYVKEGIPFYSVEHVTANQFTDTKYISKEVFEKENEKVRLEKGDILMTKIGDIGTARLIDWDVEASFYVSLALLKQSKLILPEYLNQYLASRNFQLELWKRIIHVAFPKKINLGEIGNCKILVPVNEEQKKIANYLSNIDNKIEIVHKQITQTQIFKKGLLQQMFV